MKEWLYLSIINTIIYSVYIILIKYLGNEIDYLSILTYINIIAFVYLLIYQLVKNKIWKSIKNKGTHNNIVFEKLSILFGIWTGVIYYLINKAVILVTNPGLVAAIFRIQIIISSILSYFIYGSHMSYFMMILLCIILVGLFLIGYPDKNKAISKNNTWIILSIISAFMGSIGIIILKYINIKHHNKYTPIQILFNIIIGICIFAIINELIQTKSLEITYKKTKYNIKITSYILLLILGLIFPAYVYLLIRSVKTSPNPCMPFAIVTSSIIIISIISSFLFKNSVLDYKKWIGMVLVLAGVFGLSYIR